MDLVTSNLCAATAILVRRSVGETISVVVFSLSGGLRKRIKQSTKNAIEVGLGLTTKESIEEVSNIGKTLA